MQAVAGYSACMKRQAARGAASGRARKGGAPHPAAALQYTVRNIPVHVDRALRRKASEERKSLNEVLRQALIREAGLGESLRRLHADLDTLAGKWVDDPGFDEAIRAQDQVDESLWR